MLIESARQVMASHTAAMVDAATGDYLGDAGDAYCRAKPGMILLDAFTASAIVAVYDAISPENRVKLSKMDVTSAVAVVWKVIK